MSRQKRFAMIGKKFHDAIIEFAQAGFTEEEFDELVTAMRKVMRTYFKTADRLSPKH